MVGQFELSDKERSYISEIVYSVLASEYFLQSRTLTYHWNVTGPHFSVLHALFETQYNWQRETIDTLAERIRALDFFVSLQHAQLIESSCLAEENDDADSAQEMINDLVECHEQVASLLRVGIEKTNELKDYGSADLLTGLLREHEKQLWILKSQQHHA